MITNYTPIVVSVYNRLEHLKKCISSLLKNEEAKETVLYISSDLWASDSDKESVESVRKYIKTIVGFKEVIGILNDHNKGAHDSICDAINFVLKKHESFIFLEDDIVVAPFFLKYMNEGLNLFEKNKNIFGICGFTTPGFKKPKHYQFDTFLWARNCPWGFGTWKDRWNNLDLELSSFPNFVKNKKEVREFKKIAPSSWQVLLDDRAGIIKALDVRISYNMFVNKQVSVYPVLSLTKNNGFDGTGVNCEANKGLQNKYSTMLIAETPIFHSLKIEPNKRIYRIERRLHSSFLNDSFRPFIRKTFIGKVWRSIKNGQSNDK